MSRKKDSHKKLIEASFGVQTQQSPSINPLDLEEHEQFGSRFSYDSLQNHKDKQYDNLMKEFEVDKTVKPNDIEKTPKYLGKKVLKDDLYDDFIDSNLESSDKELKNAKNAKNVKNVKNAKNVKNVKNVKSTTKPINTKPQNFDHYLEEIDQEDEKEEILQAKIDIDTIQRSKSVEYQLKIYKIFLSLRMQFQPILDLIKKYPKKPPQTEQNLGTQLLITFLLQKVSSFQDDILKKSSFPKEIMISPPAKIYNCISPEIVKEEIDCEAIYEEFDSFYKGYFGWAEQILTKWSEKTNILSSNLSKTGLKNLLHTPIGQVNKMMENIEKLQMKSQLKRGNFRILGENLEDLEKDYDENIYDDSDLMQEMLKNYIEPGFNETISENMPLFDTTRQYLLERKLKTEERKNKNLDRRASKNRKIRYDVHAKLINFMQSDDRGDVIEGRDEIIKSIKRRFEGEVDDDNYDDKLMKKIKKNKSEPKLI